MEILPPLDAHAHIDPSRQAEELTGCGLVLAATLSLDEADRVLARDEAHVIWGVGCHPRKLKAQQAFDADRFAALSARSLLISEVGLDTGSPVAMRLQQRVFRQVLQHAAASPHFLSVHSYRANPLVLEELRRARAVAPILHWWTGSAAETREAVRLGCYFSIHSAVARHSKFRTAVPPERLLVETDLGWADPPAAIPCRVEWVEHLMGVQLQLDQSGVRRLVWRNFDRLAQETGTSGLLPPLFRSALLEAG